MKLLLKVNSEKTRKRHQRTNAATKSSLITSSFLSTSNVVPTQQRIAHNRSDTNTTVIQKCTATSKVVIVLIIMVLITTAITIYVELTRHNAEGKKRGTILFGNNYDHDTLENLGNGHRIVDREQWGTSEYAKPLTIPLKHPVPYVVITHVGVQNTPCENIYDCSVKMRTIQDAAIAEKKLPDINSNFYVAGDGNVYVGRGWHFANTYANDTLAVTFLGDYGRYHPNPKQLDATISLLNYAEKNKYLTSDYKLVSQNQTKSTKSPGVNVYRHISKWPHFYPCGMNGNPKCGSELGMPAVWDGTM